MLLVYVYRKFASVRHKTWHSLVPVGRATRPVMDSDDLFASSLHAGFTADAMMTSLAQERCVDQDYEPEKFFSSGHCNYLDSNFLPTT